MNDELRDLPCTKMRYETYISGLAMRYIEFLEDLRTRNNCNQKLQQALDQVDNNLASISVEIDRLASIIRQDKAPSLLTNWYINKKADSSVGYVGRVDLQIKEKHKERNEQRVSTKKQESFISVVRPSNTNTGPPYVRSAVTAQGTQFPCKDLSDFYYDIPWSEIINYENSEVLPDPSARHSTKSCTISYGNKHKKVSTFVDKKLKKYSRDKLFEPSSREYGFKYPLLSCDSYESRGKQSPLRSQYGSSSRFPRELVSTERDACETLLLTKDPLKKNIADHNRWISDENDISSSSVRSLPRFSKVGGDSSQILVDDNAVYDVDGILGSDLERYMRRIPKLYPIFSRSSEKQNLEQNKIGDLLNVPLLVDNVDLPSKERKKPEESKGRPNNGRILSLEFGTFLDRAEQVSTDKTEITSEGGNLVVTRRADALNRNRDVPISSDIELRQLPLITSLSNASDIYGDDIKMEHSGNVENRELLTKDKINLHSVRGSTASESSSPLDNENSAHLSIDDNRAEQSIISISTPMSSTKIIGNTDWQAISVRKNVEINHLPVHEVSLDLCSTNLQEMDKSKNKMDIGNEIDTENGLHEYVEDMDTPFNLCAIEISVQESMVWNRASEPQTYSIQSESEDDLNGRSEDQDGEIAPPRIVGPSDQVNEDEYTMNEHMANGEEPSNRKTPWVNDREPLIMDPFGVIPEVQNPNLDHEYPDNEQCLGSSSNKHELRECGSKDDAQLKGEPNGVDYFQADLNQKKQDPGDFKNLGRFCTTENEQHMANIHEKYTIEPNTGYSRESKLEIEEFVTGPENMQSFNQKSEPPPELDYEADRDHLNETPIALDDSQDYDNKPTHKSQTSIRESQSTNKSLNVVHLDKSISVGKTRILEKQKVAADKTDDVIKLLLDSDTESTIEQNVSNAESDFDFN